MAIQERSGINQLPEKIPPSIFLSHKASQKHGFVCACWGGGAVVCISTGLFSRIEYFCVVN